MSLSSIVSSGTSSRATTRNSTSYGSSTSAASSTHSGNAHTASPTSTSHSSSRASSSSHSLSSTHAPAAHSSVGAGQQFSASLQNTVQSQSASQSHVVSSRQSSARAATVSRTSSTSASTRAKWTASASGSKPVNGGPIGVQSSTGSIVESSTYQVVTMYTTAVESNRVYVTITSTSFQAGLTAFPVSGNESVASGRSSFFSNTDAVAGVFLVIGIVFALLAGLLLCVLRRRRRKNEIRGMIGMPAPLPDPFADSPPMRTVLVSRTDERWSSPHAFHSDDGHDEKGSINYDSDNFTVPVLRSAEWPTNHTPVTGPLFGDYHVVERHGATPIATEIASHNAARAVSPALSSPSLYPVSEEDSEYPSEEYRRASFHVQRKIVPPIAALAIKCRGTQTVIHDYRPPTPSSTASHLPSDSELSTQMSEKQSCAGSLLINRSIGHYNPNAPVRPQRSVRRLL